MSDAPSGLRNPAAAVRGAGSAALGAEAVVMLLAIVPLNVLGRGYGGVTALILVAFAAACAALAGLLRRPWAWHAASGLQVVLFAVGIGVHLSLAALAVLFGLVWAYVLSVRQRVLRT